jgi:hypothetical protein
MAGETDATRTRSAKANLRLAYLLPLVQRVFAQHNRIVIARPVGRPSDVGITDSERN